MVFLIGLKDFTNMRHGFYSGFKIRMQIQTHGGIDGRTQTGGLVNLGFGGGQTEYIGG